MADASYIPKVYDKLGGDEMVVASGGAITVEEGGAINGPNGSSLIEETLTLDIADLSADSAYYLVCPHAGKIKKIWSVIDGVVGTADITITPSIAGVDITNGAITITQSGSAAGDIDSATPTAANAVTAGQAVKFTVAGGGSGGSPRGHISMVVSL